MLDVLRTSPLFAELPDADLDLLVSGSREESVPEGTIVFQEGDLGDHACLIIEGEVEIIRSRGGTEILLAVRHAGDVIGEMSLLSADPRMATVRARSAARFLCISKAQMDELLATSATAARSLFGVLLDRWRETEARMRHSERMAQIGTLTAGLAHEMNNPAAAIVRTAQQMEPALERLRTALARTGDDGRRADLPALMEKARSSPGESSLDAADREAEIEHLLTDRGVEGAWRPAAEIASAGLRSADVAPLLDEAEDPAGLTELIAAHADIHALLREMHAGSSRLSTIVAALKSYSHLDRAELTEIDVVKGIEDTLLLLRSKLESIEVRWEVGEAQLVVEGHSAELNQVWTNLIDNAADALADTPEPVITIRARGDDGRVIVEIQDNGPGIDPSVRDKIFDPFFTTKPPGAGTGLGLDISRSIVFDRHGGEISVESEPGSTTFRVSIPCRPPTRPHDD